MIRLDYNEESQGNASNYPALLYTRRKKKMYVIACQFMKKKKGKENPEN